MKKNNGVTLIALTITIIVLMIIASVGTYTGINALNEAKEQKDISELEMMQHAILEEYTKYITTKNTMYIRGTKINYSEVQTIISQINSEKTSKENEITLKVENYDNLSEEDITKNYYELKEQDLKEMGIKLVNYTYIVNYATGEVINKTKKITVSGAPLYIYSVDYTKLDS